MRILVFSNSAWDNTNATGNTLSNFFGKQTWKDDVFFNISIRDGKPNNDICKIYYQLLLPDMIKNYFHKERIGKEFILDQFNNNNDSKNSVSEKKLIGLVHKYSLNFLYSIANYIYRRKSWLNEKFKKFIANANPDIFYAHVNNFAILKPVIEYVKNNTNAKIVLLLTDDLYHNINCNNNSKKKLEKEFKEIISMADKIYAISVELKNDYSTIFNKKIDILYKGCVFDYPVKTKVNHVIKFVYAGNLLYGRDDILFKIAMAIENSNNHNNQKAVLEIYTNSYVSQQLSKKLNVGTSSIILGKRDYEEIKKIMNDADYTLHVESFDNNIIKKVRYSFSTKIIDCLQSGSAVLAIGPSTISSIRYMLSIPGVKVIDNVEDIDSSIKNLIIENKKIISNSKIIRNYALENHDIIKNQKKLRNDFLKLKK